MTNAGKTKDSLTHKGACHCGAVQFEVDAPATPVVKSCTCSICAATGFLHLIVEADAFRIIAGEDNLTEYRFNTGVARHLFCKTCGVKPFYVPRSHPDGWSANANCVDKSRMDGMTLTEFDGANWETFIHEIT